MESKGKEEEEGRKGGMGRDNERGSCAAYRSCPKSASMVSGVFGITRKVANHCEPTTNVGEKPECMSEAI